MKILLDTNALLWATVQPQLLTPAAANAIADEKNTIIVSAASAWEIGTKVRLGKLPMAVSLEADFIDTIRRAGYTLVPIDVETALRAARLMATHRDPFDRILAAQALAADMPIVSADSKLDLFGVRRIW